MKSTEANQARMATEKAAMAQSMQGAAQPYPPVPGDILEGIQFHRKADRATISERITKAVSHASAIARIVQEDRSRQKFDEMESHYQFQVARLEADLREAYSREANHLIDRAREGNRVVTRGGSAIGTAASEAAWRHDLALAV